MKPSQMNKAQLREARNELEKRLKDTLRPTRITGLTDWSVSIEGGRFPATYTHYPLRGELSIWGRGSRYSGASMTIDQLAEAERIVQAFFFELHEGEEDNELESE